MSAKRKEDRVSSSPTSGRVGEDAVGTHHFVKVDIKVRTLLHFEGARVLCWKVSPQVLVPTPGNNPTLPEDDISKTVPMRCFGRTGQACEELRLEARLGADNGDMSINLADWILTMPCLGQGSSGFRHSFTDGRWLKGGAVASFQKNIFPELQLNHPTGFPGSCSVQPCIPL